MPPKGESRGGALDEFPEHPLFPIEEGGKSFEVSFIQIARKEGGAMCFCPQVFRSEELTSLDQITERFGGGTYELYARSNSPTNPGAPARITKRRMVTLAGRPKPIDPTNATMAEEVAAGIRPSPFDVAKQPQGGLTGDSAVVIAIMQMGQQAAQAQAAQSQQFMALMMQMMQEGKKESAESMRMMMQMMTTLTTSQQNSMMQLIPLMVQSKGGGPEEITKWVETMKSLGFGKAESSKVEKDENEEPPLNVGEVLSNVAEIVKGAPAALDALKSMGPGGPPPTNGAVLPPMAPGAEPPPGSAAAVLAGKG
jgi:hypothetical protein